MQNKKLFVVVDKSSISCKMLNNPFKYYWKLYILTFASS
jgi:hypothetical protein